MASIQEKSDLLLNIFRSYESCAIAFSAGVDSTVVAKAAVLALGERAVAVTGVSPSLANEERTAAVQIAAEIGIRHLELSTNEQENDLYLANNPDRCYHCKSELYNKLGDLTKQLNVAVMVNGTNWDDLGDYRPGLKAAAEQEVRSPLVECHFTKEDVRKLALYWNLPNWEKPAAPCLASRVAYGLEVTPERLRRIDQAEQFLRDEFGIRELRVRYHEGDLARVEVTEAKIKIFLEPAAREKLNAYFSELGFKFVTLDLLGLRSGSMNSLISLETLKSSLKE